MFSTTRSQPRLVPNELHGWNYTRVATLPSRGLVIFPQDCQTLTHASLAPGTTSSPTYPPLHVAEVAWRQPWSTGGRAYPGELDQADDPVAVAAVGLEQFEHAVVIDTLAYQGPPDD